VEPSRAAATSATGANASRQRLPPSGGAFWVCARALNYRVLSLRRVLGACGWPADGLRLYFPPTRPTGLLMAI